jgi:hypothetical protein
MIGRALICLGLVMQLSLGLGDRVEAQQQDAGSAARRVIIFVWDGLRADDVTPENMPNYFALARSGVVFADHHSVYPTFTMMNSASIATGTYPAVHGFYGNVVYAPNARGKNAKGSEIDFSAPAFIEDFGVVEAVRDSYQGKLTLVSTMLEAAQAKGLTTATIGKFGAAFIQDYKRGGIILTKMPPCHSVLPRSSSRPGMRFRETPSTPMSKARWRSPTITVIPQPLSAFKG